MLVIPLIFILVTSFSLFLIYLGSKDSSSSGNGSARLFSSFFIYFVISFAGFLTAIFRYINSSFVISNKRVIESSGFFGVDYNSIDFDKITDIHLNVNFIEKILGLGTIKLSSASGSTISFSCIENPHETYKLIKSLNSAR